jgi:hypothetical protein
VRALVTSAHSGAPVVAELVEQRLTAGPVCAGDRRLGRALSQAVDPGIGQQRELVGLRRVVRGGSRRVEPGIGACVLVVRGPDHGVAVVALDDLDVAGGGRRRLEPGGVLLRRHPVEVDPARAVRLSGGARPGRWQRAPQREVGGEGLGAVLLDPALDVLVDVDADDRLRHPQRDRVGGVCLGPADQIERVAVATLGAGEARRRRRLGGRGHRENARPAGLGVGRDVVGEDAPGRRCGVAHGAPFRRSGGRCRRGVALPRRRPW